MANSVKRRNYYAASLLLTDTSDECLMEERLPMANTHKVSEHAHRGANQSQLLLLW